MNNFTNVPKEKDTCIIEQEEIMIKGIPVLKQHWTEVPTTVELQFFGTAQRRVPIPPVTSTAVRYAMATSS